MNDGIATRKSIFKGQNGLNNFKWQMVLALLVVIT
jgi:hypothetical protein